MIRFLIQFLFCLVVLGVGGVVSYTYIKDPTRTEAVDDVQPVKIVQTVTVAPTTAPIRIIAYGDVAPAREVVMKTQVSGLVIRHHPNLVRGGMVAANAELVAIDPVEYELALVEKQAALVEASFDLEMEQGRQEVAAREWHQLRGELGDNQVNQALVLREPHLRRAQAVLDRAENGVARADLELSRTTVTAPFNAVVVDESIEIGRLLEAGDDVCTLAGTDAFWARVTVPIPQLQYIAFPDNGTAAAATVFLELGDDRVLQWPATVIRLLADVESTGRMARVLVRIPDPLGTAGNGDGAPPLLLGSYVRVEIDAGRLQNVLAIRRTAIRKGNTIWVVTPENTLEIRPADIQWTHKDTVFITNVMEQDEQLVVSNLKNVLPGMAVSPLLLDPTAKAADIND